MFLTFCISKIHRATITCADLNYDSTPPGNSITIDADLVEAAGLYEGQMVRINNVTRKAVPWDTYVLKGEQGKGQICLNGPPAHHCAVGDIVIILAYAMVDLKEARHAKPKTVYVDRKNKMTFIDIGNPMRG